MKTKIKLMALVAGLLVCLPMTSAWGGGGTHSTHNGSVSVAKSGEGMVYLSTEKNATSGKMSDSWSCGGSSSNDSKTFYLYAQPAAGWSFSGWSGSGTSPNNPYQVSLNAQNGSYAYTATFTKQVQLSFQATENGTYTATDGTSSIATTSGAGNLSTAKAVTMTAKPSAGYTVKTWWYQESGSERVDLGNNLSYTHTFKADAVVGVEFMVKGDTVLNKTTGLRYRSLDAAVADVAAGEELELIDNDELAADVTVPADVRFVIPAAKSYVVPSGKTLTVDGTVIVSGSLAVDGTVDGAGNLVKSLKVIAQTGMGANGQAPYAPYEMMKYFKTTVTTETGTVGGAGTTSCAQSPFVKIVRYNGVCSYHALGASTTVVYCSVDLTVANNCIKDFVANYDTLGAAFDGKASSGGWANAYKLGGVAILLANGSISKGSSTNIASSLAVDCAGKTLSVTAKQINNTAVILAFNASSASMPKLTSGGAWFVNCDSCKVSEVNVNSDYQSNVRYFDCGKTSAPGYTVTNGDGNGGMFFFAGEYWTYAYTVSFKSYYRVYSGLFKNDPTSYLAENDLEVVKEGTYYRVRKQAPKVLTVQVGDQQYETLQEAVNAANGGKVKLLQDIELTGDLTVAAGQVCTIELAGFDISGFSIINHGTLTIEDSSNFDTYGLVSSAIVNDGTLKTVYGEYTGTFTAAGGTFTLQGGVYRSSLSGVCFDIRSGKFTSDVSARLNGRRIISSGGFYWVGPEIHASKEQKSLSGTDIAFTFSPLDPPEDLVLYRKHLTDGFNRSKYSDAEWYRLSELYYSVEPIVTCTTECTLCFDRDVEAGSVTGYGKVDIVTKSDIMPSNHPAHSLYWTTIPQIWASGSRPISYNRFLSGDVPAPTAGVKNNSNKNIGTTCTIAFQYGIAKEGCWIRDSAGARMYIDWDFYPLVSHDYKFTGGDKKAMIDYVLKDTLQTAVNQIEDGGTILLANDDGEAVVVNREVSFTLDANNFTFTGSISAASGFTLTDDGNGTYTVTRDLPPVAKIGDVEYTDILEAMAKAKEQKATLVLLDDVTADVKLTPDWSLKLNGWQVLGALEVADEYKADYWLKRSGDLCSVAPYVAQVGDAKYSSLANALNAAKYATKGDDGAVTVLLLRDTSESVVLPEGVKLDKRNHEVGAVKTAGGYFKVVADGEVLSVDIDYVTVVNGVVYQSFDAAVAAVAEGGTVKVVKNCTSEQLIAKTVTIELGSFEVAGLAANEEKGFVLSELVNGVRTVTQPVVAVALEQTFESLADAIAAIADLLDAASTEVEIELKKNCSEHVSVNKPCKFALTGDFAFTGEIVPTGDLSVCRNGDVWSVVAAQKVATHDEKSIVKVNSDVFAAVKETLESGVTGEVSDDDVKGALSDAIADALKSPGAVIDKGLAKVGTDQETNLKTIDVELDKNVTKGELATGLYQATKIVEIEVADGVKKSVTVLDEADDVKPDAVIKTESKRTSLILAVPGDKVKVGTELVPVTVDNVIAAGAMTDDAIVVFRVVNGVSVPYSWRFDGTDWKANDNGPEATEIELTAGSAFRYERPSYNPAPIAVTVVAQYEADADLSTTVQEDGWNIVANPNVDKPFSLNEIVPDQNAATEDALAQDEIIVPEDNGQRVYTYVAGQWGYDATTVEEKKVGGRTIRIARKERKTDALIEAGKGFWYNSKAAKPTIPWRKVGAK